MVTNRSSFWPDSSSSRDRAKELPKTLLSGSVAARITGSRLKELVITDSIQPTEAVQGREHSHTLDRPLDRGSDRPHRVGGVGVEFV
jgi:hypothetical protein